MDNLATIELIDDVKPHNNADLLEIVQVGKYDCIVKKGVYAKGNKICFISPDTVLPDKPWAAFYKSKSNRVRAIKIRGIFSFGIVESLSNLELDPNLPVGTDVSDILGITHYVSPTDGVGGNGDVQCKSNNLPFNIFKSDETHYKKLKDIPFGAIANCTLKIDGSSSVIYCNYVNGQWVTGMTSRSMDLKTDIDNKFTIAMRNNGTYDKFIKYCMDNNLNLALRGECYGIGFQNHPHNPHAKLPLSFAAYNILNLNTLKYEGINSPLYYETVCNAIGIETVPTLERGVVVTQELIDKYDHVMEKLPNGNYFEGCVLKFEDGSSFKVLSMAYDSKK